MKIYWVGHVYVPPSMLWNVMEAKMLNAYLYREVG